MDRPLAAYKLGVNAAVIAPHTNWRGQFSGGTYLQGSPSTAPVSWPGYSTTAWYQGQPPQEQNRVYMGTVLEGQRDASGQMYKRNRFYDPQTGQFTQTDPIGVAGGLNTYGFAAGDPVSYSDPYGLAADTTRRQALPMDNGAAEVVPWYQSPEFYVATLGAGWVAGRGWGALTRGARRLFGGEKELQPFDTNNPLSTFTREYVTEGGTIIDVSVQAVTQGRTLRVAEIAVYRRGGDLVNSVGGVGMRRVLRALENEARERGYTRVEGVAHRTKDGRTVPIDKDLQE